MRWLISLKKYKLKLAMVISSLEIGGAEKMVVDLIKDLKEEIEVKLFIIKKNFNSCFDQEVKKSGISVQYFNHKIKVFSLLVAFRLKKALDEYRPDIIHTHLKASTYICFYNIFNKNFKWIHTIHTIPKVDTKILRRLFFKKLYNNNRINLVTVSPSIKKDASLLYKNAKVRNINNGVNLDIFKPIRKSNNVTLICVGRLEAVKNYEYIILEVSKLVKVIDINKMYIVGNGSKKEQLVALIKEYGLDSIIEIIAYTDKVNMYLNSSDIFINASFYEGMSLSVIEALASGLIVIASTASKDIVKNEENGFIIDFNSDSLFNKLKEVISKINSLDDIRLRAVDSAKEYSITKMKDEYLKLYLEE